MASGSERHALFASAALCLVLGWATSAAAYCAYVANSESNLVSVIDTATNTVSAEIEEQCSNGACHPPGLALTPDARFLYVANRGDRENPCNTVSVIATASNTVVATVTVASGPSRIAITPGGAFAYVTGSFSDNSVSVIDTAKALTDPAAASETLHVDHMPFDVVISPDGDVAYVSSCGTPCDGSASSVAVVDTHTNTIQTRVPAAAIFLSITPNGGFLYGTNLTADIAFVIDASRALTEPSHALIKTIPVGGTPYGPATTPDGHFVYVPNCGEFCLSSEPSAASSVSVIDVTANEVATTLALPATSAPSAVAFTPDGAFAYVTYAEASAVAVIDTAKVFADPAHAVIKEIAVAGPRPAAVVIASVPGGCGGTGIPCVGDCGGDGEVTVNEIITMVNVALGTTNVSACMAGDANGDGEITINEIVAAVNNALNGC